MEAKRRKIKKKVNKEIAISNQIDLSSTFSIYLFSDIPKFGGKCVTECYISPISVPIILPGLTIKNMGLSA